MNIQAALAPHLPSQVHNSGVTASQLQTACQNHAQSPKTAPEPYEDGMSQREQVQWSKDLGQLAGGAQADFAKQTGGQLRVPQLQDALRDLSQAKEDEAACAKFEIKELKHAYYGQVARTAGWMGGTLATLVATGMLPNPVTAIGAFVCGGMCIRSIGKSRAAAKELGAQVPVLQAQMKNAQKIAAEASMCAPLVGAWGQLLA
jgi:hypothetical protein